MPNQTRSKILLQLVSELATAHMTAVICLERIRQELLDSGSPAAPAAGYPAVEVSSFCVLWRGRSCPLGPTTSFRLMGALLRRPGQYLRHDELLREVWRGDSRSPDTIRSAVRHLRTKLAAAGMADVAAAVRGHGRHYGFFVARSK